MSTVNGNINRKYAYLKYAIQAIYGGRNFEKKWLNLP